MFQKITQKLPKNEAIEVMSYCPKILRKSFQKRGKAYQSSIDILLSQQNMQKLPKVRQISTLIVFSDILLFQIITQMLQKVRQMQIGEVY